jgi:hypothetical protein
MGGGAAISPDVKTEKGFNLKLPSARVDDDETLDKLNYYDQAHWTLQRWRSCEKKTKLPVRFPADRQRFYHDAPPLWRPSRKQFSKPSGKSRFMSVSKHCNVP